MIQIESLQHAQARVAAITNRFVRTAPRHFEAVLTETRTTMEPSLGTLSALPTDSRGHAAWSSQIEAAAERAGVDARLFTALVRAESGFDSNAVSPSGAIGLSQLMPATAADLGVDPHDPLQNLHGGATYLRQMIDRFGDVPTALAAYNAGPGRVAQAGGIPDIPETRTYVERVLSFFEQLGGSA